MAFTCFKIVAFFLTAKGNQNFRSLVQRRGWVSTSRSGVSVVVRGTGDFDFIGRSCGGGTGFGFSEERLLGLEDADEALDLTVLRLWRERVAGLRAQLRLAREVLPSLLVAAAAEALASALGLAGGFSDERLLGPEDADEGLLAVSGWGKLSFPSTACE